MTTNIVPDGYSTIISFSLNADVKFKEKEVQPPGIDVGGGVDQTTMRNIKYRTQLPKQLVSITPQTIKVAYDPAVYDQIMDMVGKNQEITTEFADGTPIGIWGWIDSFIPDSVKEGTQPEATVKIEPSMLNNSGVETGIDLGDPTTTTTTTTV